jgi:hypothetical protein
LSLLKNSADKLCLEGLQEVSQVYAQVNKFRGGTLSHFVDSKGRTDGRNSPRRFREFREPLDLAEVQGDTARSVKRFKAQEGQSR